MKRSNRLVLLVGVFLAVVAFVGILLLVRSPQGGEVVEKPATTGPVVVASVDIPLSSRIREDQVTTTIIALDAISPGAYKDPSQVIGQVVRQPVGKGAQITSTTIGASTSGTVTNIATPAGKRSIAVQVDQVTGVGTAIKTGDFVDMIIGLTDVDFPVINPDGTVVTGLNSTSVKVLIQGLQVVGTLLPPVTTTETATTASPSPSTGGSQIPLNGQSEIVILAGSAQQVEQIKFVQLSKTNPAITLVLRSPDDFVDPVTGQPIPPETSEVRTTGIILKTLVDNYGVLPPELVETVTPTIRRPAASAAP